MDARILHISDLHLGRREAPEPVSALGELLANRPPDLVVATGDLTHRGRRPQLERAAELLEGLGARVLAVPGNHDIPYTFPARFTSSFSEWKRVFGSLEPAFSSERLALVGLNSVRAWRQQGGGLAAAQLDRLASTFAETPPGVLRAVALHHHLAAPPWRAARKRPLRHRDDVLDKLSAAGVELVLGGHVHQAAVAERREFEVVEGGRSIVLATAPGFSRPRPRRRGEALGFNVYEWDASSLTVVTWAWDGAGFVEVGGRTFSRG